MTVGKLLKLYANREEDFWAWRDAVEKFGIDATLDALGYSKDRAALWYNENTGSIETLGSLIAGGSMHFKTIKPREELREELAEFAMALENWLPQTGTTNPILARAAALSEADVLQQVSQALAYAFKHNHTASSFSADVCRGGATLPDGSYTGITGGKVRVSLHDDRKFVFSTNAIYQFIKKRREQPTLF